MKIRPLYDRIVVKRIEDDRENGRRVVHSRFGQREAAGRRSDRRRPGQARR